MAEWQNDRVAERLGMAEWQNGGMAEWQNGGTATYRLYLKYLQYTPMTPTMTLTKTPTPFNLL